MFRIVLKLAEFRRIEFQTKTKDTRSPPRFKRRRDIDRYCDNYCYNIALYISMDVCTNRFDARLLWNRANRSLYLEKANRIVIRSVTTCARTYVTALPSIVYRKQVCTWQYRIQFGDAAVYAVRREIIAIMCFPAHNMFSVVHPNRLSSVPRVAFPYSKSHSPESPPKSDHPFSIWVISDNSI